MIFKQLPYAGNCAEGLAYVTLFNLFLMSQEMRNISLFPDKEIKIKRDQATSLSDCLGFDGCQC